MSVSTAKRLLAEAAGETARLRRHLLVAAALREVLPGEPVVVGGTAEEFWTADEYHETDLDVCVPLGSEGRRALGELGFAREGRHWSRPDIPAVVEFPEPEIDGEMSRTRLEPLGEGAARIIGIDDLYIDRLRQATVAEGAEGVEFHSALAVAAAGQPSIDRAYVDARIEQVIREARFVGESMRRLDAKIRRRVRRSL